MVALQGRAATVGKGLSPEPATVIIADGAFNVIDVMIVVMMNIIIVVILPVAEAAQAKTRGCRRRPDGWASRYGQGLRRGF